MRVRLFHIKIIKKLENEIIIIIIYLKIIFYFGYIKNQQNDKF